MSFEDELRALSPNENTVLTLRCRGLNYEQIGIQLNHGPDWVQLQMSNVYRKLDFKKEMHWKKRKEILEHEVCPSLKKLLENEPEITLEQPTKEPEIPPDPQMLAIVLFDEMMIEEYKKNPLVTVPPPFIPPPPPPPPLIIPPPPNPIIKRIRLLIYSIVLIAAISAIVFYAYRLGQQAQIPLPTVPAQLQPSTNTPIPLSTATSTSQPTDTPIPTLTSTPQPSATPQPTQTPLPTATKSPLGLAKGDSLSDNRVTLLLQDIQYNKNYDGVGARIAPVSFFFDFTNHSGDVLLLQLTGDNFITTDNTGYTAKCAYGGAASINVQVNNQETKQITARCGLGLMNPSVKTVTLSITGFSSLTDSTWIVEVPR
jgi:DNA-binding CsgD family transcriptional regulator